MKISPFLKQVPLFSGLSGGDLARVVRIAQVREARKGETIFSQESTGDTLFVVVRGMVKIYTKSQAGKIKTFDYLEPRDFFGEMALLEKADRSAAAVATVPSTLLTIRRQDFQGLLAKRPRIAVGLLKTLCERLRRADREIESMSFNSVLGRVARTLLDLSRRHGKKTSRGLDVGLELSHRELADMVGTAREMVTRVLSRFARTGCLEMNGKSLTLTNVDKLKEWIY